MSSVKYHIVECFKAGVVGPVYEVWYKGKCVTIFHQLSNAEKYVIDMNLKISLDSNSEYIKVKFAIQSLECAKADIKDGYRENAKLHIKMACKNMLELIEKE